MFTHYQIEIENCDPPRLIHLCPADHTAIPIVIEV